MDHNLKRKLFLEWAASVNQPEYDGHRTELGFLTKEGKLVISTNHACHAGLFHSRYWMFIDSKQDFGETPEYEDEEYISESYEGSYSTQVKDYSFNKDPIVVIYSTIIDKERMTRSHMLMFADYLIHRSPWKDCFLNPTSQDVVDNCWVLDASQPSNYIAGACMATRWITEWPSRCRAWVAMVEAGVCENEAMLFSHGLQSDGVEKEELFPIIFDAQSAWHSPLEKSFDKEYLSNFVQGIGRKDDVFSVGMRYGQVQRTWGRGSSVSYEHFTGIKPRGEEKQVAEKINLNIFFKPKKPKAGGGARHKFTSHIQLKNLVEDMKEIIYAA
jgi:hypothetical protein